ncbi:hypothetical protein GYH30_001278 [Glycine max]|nr:hypothetical protein GYH30_001278 [Glycine max]
MLRSSGAKNRSATRSATIAAAPAATRNRPATHVYVADGCRSALPRHYSGRYGRY